jgi:tetratricopeptide (TPR) repeat protein
MRFIALVSFCLITPLFAFAQPPNSTAPVQTTEAPVKKKITRINLNSSGAIRINYGQPRWNKSPQEIDTATVIMREGVSGRVVQIQLNETAPDSSVFSGRYSINWQNMEKLETEFYIPSQEMLAQKDGLMKVTQKIQAKEIPRNPFIFRKLPTGEQSIEIFDTKDQARSAMKAYRAEQLVMIQNQKPTKFPSDEALETEKEAAAKQERELAARAASDRARMEQIESARLADLIAKQNAMSATEKAAKKEQAAVLGREGMALYNSEDYRGAHEKFDQAVSMDPDNHAFYFQYGVVLYKTENYNRALVFLSLATGQDVNPAERNYFMALTHMKLRRKIRPSYRLRSFTKARSTMSKKTSTRLRRHFKLFSIHRAIRNLMSVQKPLLSKFFAPAKRLRFESTSGLFLQRSARCMTQTFYFRQIRSAMPERHRIRPAGGRS